MPCSASSTAIPPERRLPHENARSQVCTLPIAVPPIKSQTEMFLVRVQRTQFRRQAQKPYYTLTLVILEPSRFSDRILSSASIVARRHSGS